MAVLAIGAVSAASGCSFIFADGPPEHHERMPYFDCSSSYAAPVADTIVGVAGLYVVALLATSTQSDPTVSTLQISAVPVISTLAFGASAIYGYKTVSDCKVAKQELIRAQPMQQWSPRPSSRGHNGTSPADWPPAIRPPVAPPPAGEPGPPTPYEPARDEESGTPPPPMESRSLTPGEMVMREHSQARRGTP